jgi:hypothetical protein
MPTAPPIPQTDKQSRLDELLARPLDQRLREYKYRFAQSVVFGLPVIALQWWGGALGPVDSPRWASLLQSLLCGWVVYVNLGMLFEGLLAVRLRLRGDFIVAGLGVALYVYSLVSALHGIITSRLWYPVLFHLCIMLLATWSGWRWLRLRAAVNAASPAPPRSA